MKSENDFLSSKSSGRKALKNSSNASTSNKKNISVLSSYET